MNTREYNEGTHETGWSGFVAEAVLGAGITLLLTSERGAELRGILSDYASRAKDDLLERAEEAYDKGEEGIRDAGQSARKFVKEGQEAVNKAGRSAKEFAQHLQDADREAKC